MDHEDYNYDIIHNGVILCLKYNEGFASKIFSRNQIKWKRQSEEKGFRMELSDRLGTEQIFSYG